MQARVVFVVAITAVATASGADPGDDRVRASCNRPAAGRVGSCSFEPLGSATEVVHVYRSPATSVTTARRLCTSGQLELGSGLLRLTSDNPDLLALGEPGTWSANATRHHPQYARRPARRGAVNVREAKDEQADDEASSIARGGTGTGDAMSRPETVINYESDLLCAPENEDPGCTSAAATRGGDGK